MYADDLDDGDRFRDAKLTISVGPLETPFDSTISELKTEIVFFPDTLKRKAKIFALAILNTWKLHMKEFLVDNPSYQTKEINVYIEETGNEVTLKDEAEFYEQLQELVMKLKRNTSVHMEINNASFINLEPDI